MCITQFLARLGWINGLYVYDDKLIRRLSETERKNLPGKVLISLKEQINKFVQQNSLAISIELAQSFVSVLFLLNIVMYDYIVYNTNKPNLILTVVYLVLEFCLYVMSFFFYLMKTWKHTVKIFFWTDFFLYPISMSVTGVDFVCMLVFGETIILKYMRIWGVFGYIMLLKLLPSVSVTRSFFRKKYTVGTKQQISFSVMLIISLVILGALVIQIMQNEFGDPGLKRLSFDKTLFILVTVSQLQIFIDDITWWMPQMVLTLVQYLAVLLLLQQITSLYYILQKEGKKLIQRGGLVSRTIRNHCIIDASAGIHVDEISDFVREFFDVTHGKNECDKIYIVVDEHLSEEKAEEWKEMTSHSYFSQRVFVSKGNIMDFEFLRELNMKKSFGVFLLSNVTTKDSYGSDTIILSKLIALKNFSSRLKVHCHIIEPDNRLLFFQAEADIVVCSKDLKTKILGRSVITPGLPTILSNLMYSATFDLKVKKSPVWLREYTKGADQEIYVVKLSPFFHINEYMVVEVNDVLFVEFNICMLGIISSEEELKINPRSQTKIIEGDSAIVIARDIYHAHLTSVYKINDVSVAKKNQILPLGKKKKRKRKKFPSFKDDKDKGDEGGSTPESLLLKKKARNKLLDDIVLNDFGKSSTPTGVNGPKVFQIKSERFSSPVIKRTRGKRLKRVNLKVGDLEDLMKHLVPTSHIANLSRMIFLSGYNIEYDKEFFTNSKNHFCFSSVVSKYKDLEVFDDERFKQFKIPNHQFDMEELNDHVVIMGELEEALTLIFILRAKNLQKHRQIVLFGSYDEAICKELFQTMKFFDQVYYFEGDCTDPIALKNVRLMTAYSVVYLRPDVEFSKSGSIEILDGRCIRSRISISAIARNIRKVSELIFRRNVKFFTDFSSDSALVKGIRLDNPVDNKFEKRYLLSPPIASGSVFSQSFMLRILCQSYFNNKVVDIVETLSGFDGNFNCNSTVNIYPIPQMFVNKRFHTLYRYYLHERNVVVVGLYRKDHEEKDDKEDDKNLTQKESKENGVKVISPLNLEGVDKKLELIEIGDDKKEPDRVPPKPLSPRENYLPSVSRELSFVDEPKRVLKKTTSGIVKKGLTLGGKRRHSGVVMGTKKKKTTGKRGSTTPRRRGSVGKRFKDISNEPVVHQKGLAKAIDQTTKEINELLSLTTEPKKRTTSGMKSMGVKKTANGKLIRTDTMRVRAMVKKKEKYNRKERKWNSSTKTNSSQEKPWQLNKKYLKSKRMTNLRKKMRKVKYKKSFVDEKSSFEGFYFVYTFPDERVVINEGDFMYCIGNLQKGELYYPPTTRVKSKYRQSISRPSALEKSDIFKDFVKKKALKMLKKYIEKPKKQGTRDKFGRSRSEWNLADLDVVSSPSPTEEKESVKSLEKEKQPIKETVIEIKEKES